MIEKSLVAKASNAMWATLHSRLASNRKLPPKIWVFFANFFLFLERSPLRIQYFESEDLFSAQEGDNQRSFKSRTRGVWLYRQGISTRGRSLFESYCLGNIEFTKGDIVVDCGANSGDLSIEFERVFPEILYVGIEPSPQDFRLLSLNVNLEKNILIPQALAEEDGVRALFLAPETGDSSLIRPQAFEQQVNISVTSLDTLLTSLNLSEIKLLKVEAEGFEPEILHGAERILSEVHFIAVDGGYERGVANEQTFTVVTNFLLSRGFELVDVYFPWQRGLFRNVHLQGNSSAAGP